MQTLFFIFRCC